MQPGNSMLYSAYQGVDNRGLESSICKGRRRQIGKVCQRTTAAIPYSGMTKFAPSPPLFPPESCSAVTWGSLRTCKVA